MQSIIRNVRFSGATSRMIAGRRFASTAGTTKASKAPKKRVSFLGVASVVAVASASYALGSLYPPALVTFLYPHPAPPPPISDSPEGLAETARVENALQNLPIVKELRAKSDAWYETRPYAEYPEEKRVHSLTSGSLRGPSKLAVPPILFATHDDSETVVLLHAGRSLCGHDGIVHGGLLATLLDETLARTAIVNLPNKIGVTANLSINYRAPTKADQFLVIKTKLNSQEGRKAKVYGRVEDLKGTLLVEANATFVEPRYANMLKSSAVTAAMGKRSVSTASGKVPVPQEASV